MIGNEAGTAIQASCKAVSIVVAIPVCNERRHILACLQALADQRDLAAGSLGVLLFFNNCTDGTERLIADAAFPLPLRVLVVDSPEASAGWARRHAMEAAASWLDENRIVDGVLLTTDADSRVPSDWIARNLAALDNGADAVAGRLALDAEDDAQLPHALHARGALESRYEALLVEITALLDPTPGNPWPHHWCRSGASLATRLPTYRTIGGMPDIATGEDRAFVEAVLAHDLVVRHDPDIVVVTSGRLEGRAKGGVADTIRLRCELPESLCDDRLERVNRVVARALLRRRLRRLHTTKSVASLERWARALSLDKVTSRRLANETSFARLHAAFEALSPRLACSPLRPRALPLQIRLAELVASVLRSVDRFRLGPSARRAPAQARSAALERAPATSGSQIAMPSSVPSQAGMNVGQH